MIDRITIQQIYSKEDAVKNTQIFNHPNFTFTQQANNRFQGKFKNFRFINKNNHSLILGSLTKFGYGTNAVNADRHMTDLFMEEIIEIFNLKKDSSVIELEFGFNIPVTHKVANYLNQLQYAIGYTDIFKHKGLQVKFMQENKQISLYDKTKQFNLNRSRLSNPLPPSINLLRYEVVLKNPAKVLGLKKQLSVLDLLDHKIIDKLICYWVNEFTSIIQHTNVNPCIKADKPKDVYNHLILKGVEGYGGLSMFLPMVNSIDFKEHSHEYKKRVRDTAVQLTKNNQLSSSSNLMQELENKIRFTAMHYLRQTG